MTQHEVQIGGVYHARVSQRATLVRLDRAHPHGGWDATNLHTGKTIRIRSGRRLQPWPRPEDEGPLPVIRDDYTAEDHRLAVIHDEAYAAAISRGLLVGDALAEARQARQAALAGESGTGSGEPEDAPAADTTAPEPRQPRQRHQILGHSACAVLKALGKAGLKYPEADAILKRHGIEMPKASVNVQLGFGRNEHTWQRHGQPAPLTDEQVDRLRRSEPPFA